MPKIPKLAWAAAILAFILAASAILSAILGAIVLLPAALVPLFAGVGILRRKYWAAWGYAVCVLAQPIPALVRGGTPAALLVSSVVFSVALSILFFAAGRSLERAGAAPGHVLPWLAVAALTCLPFFFIEPFSIPNGSMEETILPGDKIFVRTFPAPKLERGAIVVFIYPLDRKQIFTKRIIAVGGDRIRFSNKVLFRNGVEIKEPYVVHKTNYVDSYRDNFPDFSSRAMYRQGDDMLQHNVTNGEVVVPPGKYFVLGDNRDYSLDSRYWGFIEASDVIGRPFLIYDSSELPPDANSFQQQQPLFAHRKTRWDRILKPL